MNHLILSLLLSSFCHADDWAVVNGTPMIPHEIPQLIRITTRTKPFRKCTATLVGPRAILTSAHCAKDGEQVTFLLNARYFNATITRHSDYHEKDIDLALGFITDTLVVKHPEVLEKPLRISGAHEKGLHVRLYGEGCIYPGRFEDGDGVLRYGPSILQSFPGFEMISQGEDHDAYCVGSGGGPVLYRSNLLADWLVIGVSSKGNVHDENFSTRIGSKEVGEFLDSWSTKNKTQICGVSTDC